MASRWPEAVPLKSTSAVAMAEGTGIHLWPHVHPTGDLVRQRRAVHRELAKGAVQAAGDQAVTHNGISSPN